MIAYKKWQMSRLLLLLRFSTCLDDKFERILRMTFISGKVRNGISEKFYLAELLAFYSATFREFLLHKMPGIMHLILRNVSFWIIGGKLTFLSTFCHLKKFEFSRQNSKLQFYILSHAKNQIFSYVVFMVWFWPKPHLFAWFSHELL